MAYGAQYVKLLQAANALTGLVIFIFTRQCRIPMFEMLAQMALVCYVSEQRKAMTSLHFCTGSPEPLSLDKVLSSTQTVLWVPLMLAAQALASLNNALAHRSCRHSPKSEYTDESAQETSGPIKCSYENARMSSHG